MEQSTKIPPPLTEPMSRCSCGHTGDGPDSEHEDVYPAIPDGRGHGICKIEGCPCGKFEWEEFLPGMAEKRREEISAWQETHRGRD